jgi:hypothetical protein
MKITVDLSEKEMREICRTTGVKKKGPAIRKLIREHLGRLKREELVRKCLSGELGFEFKGYDEGQRLERKASERLANLWRK